MGAGQILVALPLLIVACIGRIASAQTGWQVHYIHPEGASSSLAHATAGTTQGGLVQLSGGLAHPVFWTAVDGYIDLLPSVGRSGQVHALDGLRQVGYVHLQNAGPVRASLWAGTAESWTDLNPVGAGGSVAYGGRGGQQVGTALFGDVHAALWWGSAETFVDLHPPVARSSTAYATDGARQGGSVVIEGVGIHAALWHGAASSFVDLNPSGSLESIVRGVAPGVQAGYARFADLGTRAVLWRGSAESFIDVTPESANLSELYATLGWVHAGLARIGGVTRAGIWLGEDPNSFIDLHALSGPGWGYTIATGLSIEGDTLYVSGYGFNNLAGQNHAMLWTGTVPTPGSGLALAYGLLVFGNLGRRRQATAR